MLTFSDSCLLLVSSRSPKPSYKSQITYILGLLHCYIQITYLGENLWFGRSFFFLLPENVTNRYLKIKWQAGETAGWVKALAIQTGELEISVQISKNHFKAGNGGVSLHNPNGKWEAKTGDSPETTGQKTWLMKQQEDPVLNKMKMGGLTSKGCPLTSVSSSPTQHIHNKQTKQANSLLGPACILEVGRV